MKTCGIKIVGGAGQGVVVAGKILALAAIYDGMNSTQTQTYGPAPRMGQVVSEVIISEEEITYFKVLSPHILLMLSPPLQTNYFSEIKPGGIYIGGADFASKNPKAFSIGIKSYYYPIEEMSRSACGSGKTSNLIALGILIGLTGIIAPKAVEEAIGGCFPARDRSANISCFYYGYQAVKTRDDKAILEVGSS